VIKKIKIGIMLMLIGIGTPAVLAFFQEDGDLFKIQSVFMRGLNDLGDETLAEMKSIDFFVSDLDPIIQEKFKSLRKLMTRWEGQYYLIKGFDLKLPYKYSVGIGIIFFLTGLGLVIFSAIGRKGRTS